MGDTADEKLAAQLAEVKRELRRKEKKLKKYSQVLGAKQHVRDTLRRHNIASESESNVSSDLVNGHVTQTELKCSVSRTVTFSAESPKVIILSPVPSLFSKRKDKIHKYRSLSTRKTQSREREKTVIETLNEESQKEVLQKEIETRTLPYSNSSLKCSDTPEEGSNMREMKTSARNCDASFDNSEMDSLSDISIHNDNTTVLKQIDLDSERSGTAVSESTKDKDIKTNLPGKEYNTAVGTTTEFSPSSRKRQSSNISVGCEATTIEDDRQTHQNTKGCQPHTLSDSFINWPEDDELPSEGYTHTSKHIPYGINRTETSNTYTVAVDNEKKRITSTHVLQQKSGLEYKIFDSRNEAESQDLFDTQFVTQTENIEIKRSCISPRKRWKYKNSQSSCSEGSGCGTSDKEDPNKRRTESMGQNIIQEVSINVPLKHLEIQKIPSNGEHLNEELMIKEMEQEMIKEFDIESSQVDDAKNSTNFKEPLVKESVDQPLPTIRKKEKLRTVVRKNKENDSEKSNELWTQEPRETQCKYENNVDNGTYKTVLNEGCCENNHSASMNEISPQKNLCQQKPCHASKECEATQNNNGITSGLVRTIPPRSNSEKLSERMTQIDKRRNDMILDLGFEKVIKSDEAKEDICKSEIDMHRVNISGKEDSVDSNTRMHKVPVNSIEKNLKFHSLLASEKHGKILTSSLVNLSHAGEESLYILIVREFGFTLWDTVRERNYSVKSGSHTNNMECSINGKRCSAKGRLEKEMWVTIGEVSHLVGRTSDIRDIVAVGLPSDEEVRYLVAVTKTAATDVQILYVQFSVKDEWLVIESRLGLSFCNTFKNLAACAVGEWSVAICWTPMEHFTDGCFVVTDLDVTYSRRSKRWELQCHSSLRSPIWDEPLGSLVALHQPDPRGVVLYTSSDKLYIYDAVGDIILHQFHWEMPAPSWAVTNEDLVFLLSMDTSTGQTCLSAFNPMNGLQETFFTTVFPDNISLCDGNTEESLKARCTSRPTSASLVLKELVVAFSNGAMIHISTDSFTGERLT